MSIIDDIGGAVGSVIGAAEDVGKFAGKVWHAFKLVWWLLTHVAVLLENAWDWVVHGVEWFGLQAEQLASHTFGTFWNLIMHTLPGLVAWTYNHSIGWAYKEILLAVHAIHKFIDDVIKWAGKAFNDVRRTIVHWVREITHWAAGAVRWVTHFGDTVWRLISHPGQLANILADHIVWPVVRWLLRSGANIVVYLLKQAIHSGSGVEHLIEDILHDML